MSKPTTNPFDLFLERIREVIREELKASNGNGHEPKLLYTTEEAAQLCGLPKTWLASAARSGKVKCRRMGSYVRFSMEDLKELVENARSLTDVDNNP
jgi:excisionase family DNA binding protein